MGGSGKGVCGRAEMVCAAGWGDLGRVCAAGWGDLERASQKFVPGVPQRSVRQIWEGSLRQVGGVWEGLPKDSCLVSKASRRDLCGRVGGSGKGFPKIRAWGRKGPAAICSAGWGDLGRVVAAGWGGLGRASQRFVPGSPKDLCGRVGDRERVCAAEWGDLGRVCAAGWGDLERASQRFVPGVESVPQRSVRQGGGIWEGSVWQGPKGSCLDLPLRGSGKRGRVGRSRKGLCDRVEGI
uniref:Uncharacterized protein n=1 Tax=Chromera velia CCMP2878 TaxID=1169474 RepID=A0A0G4HSJ5_9ALVE|eukprot:Cvel_31038.t1-p1 / transcript=Cvel_31038.t1 / gene=Cvel_31038 / organism=Chromera_velia_CCMP2878 / gene_product=Putative uncharacterized protein FLJ22184, putative / transcript_product=Putative uncharacterized protein FLJ22184, putative / location=Cvel_scaffold4546:40-750(-) / protein_length=237 / sequence_SO=supercontig / SO=protein_coding / is_pseudo=false